jgi:hypothetical protein
MQPIGEPDGIKKTHIDDWYVAHAVDYGVRVASEGAMAVNATATRLIVVRAVEILRICLRDRVKEFGVLIVGYFELANSICIVDGTIGPI